MIYGAGLEAVMPQQADKPHWNQAEEGNLFCVLGGSIVGTVTKDAFRRGWWAYGCMTDWEDTDLGCHPKKSDARRRVWDWVKEHQ